MAGYDITKLLQPGPGKAHIEVFFTQKGKDLFCIVPQYTPQLRIRNFKATPSTSATILGSNKKIRLQQMGKDCLIDLSGLRPGDVSADAFVVKLEHAR